jgi:hypothetical protein
VSAPASVSLQQAAPTIPAVKAETCGSNVHILAAIRELQIARAILLGQPIAQPSGSRTAEAKKVRASRT